jgi:hypothetical protein
MQTKKEETKQKLNLNLNCKDCSKNLQVCTCTDDTIDMKQETIEEASKKLILDEWLGDEKVSNLVKWGIEIGFEIGVKQHEGSIDENTSDGYHTFKELYEFRKAYNAALFNMWAAYNYFPVVKSYKHSDGELCFGGGWFIVTATLPTGQISNHYENKDWDLFRCEVVETAPVWDGHTSADVINRLVNLNY